MDIEEFYAADERRRASEEIGYGMAWSSALDSDHLWDCWWVAATGEVYTLRKPSPPKWLPLLAPEERARLAHGVQLLGREALELAGTLVHPRHHSSKTSGTGPERAGTEGREADDVQQLQVEVLAVVPDRDELERRLVGWKDQVLQRDSLAWLRRQLGPPTSPQA